MNGPPAQPARHSPGTHPRRRPAIKSVSLLHSRKSPESSQGPRSSEDEPLKSSRPADRPTTMPVRPAYHKNSSGESSNTERWFERSNNKVDTGTIDFADGMLSV
jgi:hypothetical protein